MPVPRSTDDVALVDLLDRVLHKGVIVLGDLTISVADVDLIYLKLNLLLASVHTLTSLAKSATAPLDLKTRRQT
jgi:hypothetical protein